MNNDKQIYDISKLVMKKTDLYKSLSGKTFRAAVGQVDNMVLFSLQDTDTGNIYVIDEIEIDKENKPVNINPCSLGQPHNGTSIHIPQDNVLSLKILLPNNKATIIDDKKVAKVQEIPDLIPFFTEIVTFHTDYSTGQVKSLPTIYGITKTKKCVRQLKDLRIMRSKRSRRVSQYVLMDGVYKVVEE